VLLTSTSSWHFSTSVTLASRDSLIESIEAVWSATLRRIRSTFDINSSSFVDWHTHTHSHLLTILDEYTLVCHLDALWRIGVRPRCPMMRYGHLVPDILPRLLSDRYLRDEARNQIRQQRLFLQFSGLVHPLGTDRNFSYPLQYHWNTSFSGIPLFDSISLPCCTACESMCHLYVARIQTISIYSS